MTTSRGAPHETYCEPSPDKHKCCATCWFYRAECTCTNGYGPTFEIAPTGICDSHEGSEE